MNVIISIFIVITTFCAVSANEVTIRVGAAVATPGGTVQVPVELHNPADKPIQASALTLVFDSRMLQAVDIASGAGTGGAWWRMCDIGSVDDTTGYIQIDLAAPQPTVLKSGHFFVIDFAVAGSVPSGTTIPLRWVEGRINPHWEQGALEGTALGDGAITVVGLGDEQAFTFLKKKRRKRPYRIYIKSHSRRAGLRV